MNNINIEKLVTLDKIGVFRHLYERGYVLIHVDARAPGVDVPLRFRDDPRLRLQLDYKTFDRYKIPPPRVGFSRLSVLLSYSGQPYECVIPWSSVFAVVGEEGLGVLWDGEKVALLRKSVPKKTVLRLVEGEFTGCSDEVDELARSNRSNLELIRNN